MQTFTLRRRLVRVFDGVYRRSLETPEAFWADAAGALDWDEPWEHVLHDSRWFVGGRMNTCFNALDRHVERGRADQVALIYDSPVTDPSRRSPTASCGTPSRASPARSRRRASGAATA